MTMLARDVTDLTFITLALLARAESAPAGLADFATALVATAARP